MGHNCDGEACTHHGILNNYLTAKADKAAAEHESEKLAIANAAADKVTAESKLSVEQLARLSEQEVAEANKKEYKVLGVVLKKPIDNGDLPSAQVIRDGDSAEFGSFKLCIIESGNRKPPSPAYFGVREQMGFIYFMRTAESGYTLFPHRVNVQDQHMRTDKVDVASQFIMTAIDPGLRIKYTLYRNTEIGSAVHRTGSVTFYAGARYSHSKKASYHGIVPSTFKVNAINADYSMDISFRSEGAEVIKLDLPAGTQITAEERRLLENLMRYVANTGIIDVNLKLVPFASDVEEHRAEIAKSLKVEKAPFGPHAMVQSWASAGADSPVCQKSFYLYCRTEKEDFNLNFNSEKSRYHILKIKPHTPFIAHPAQGRFNSPLHGEVVLGYGMINEWNEALVSCNHSSKKSTSATWSCLGRQRTRWSSLPSSSH